MSFWTANRRRRRLVVRVLGVSLPHQRSTLLLVVTLPVPLPVPVPVPVLAPPHLSLPRLLLARLHPFLI